MEHLSVKYDELGNLVYDLNLRKVIFDLANADNFDDDDYIPLYQPQKVFNYSKRWKHKITNDKNTF